MTFTSSKKDFVGNRSYILLMLPPEPSNLAAKYLVDDMPGARARGTRLHGILMKIEAGSPVSELAQTYLLTNKLHCLHSLVVGRTDFASFQRDAVIERVHRMEATEIAAAEAAAEEARRKAELARASAAFFDDPGYRRRQDSKQLRRKFNLKYIEPELYPRAMRLLQALAKGRRLKQIDVLWLQTEADECWTSEVAVAWHLVEAEVHTAAWRETRDPWDAINASSHWRKGNRAELAISLTGEALAAMRTAGPKIRAALATTRGAALRAVARHIEAKALAEDAHSLVPDDYRPCTLLGAIHIEMGDYSSGLDWFEKAEGLGAEKGAIDHDIRALLARMPEAERNRVEGLLLEEDSERFSWLRSKRDPARRSAQAR